MTLNELNRKIEDNYGQLENRARYRLVWSEDEFEHRLGTYRDYTSNGLFIREVTEVREVPKYKQWINPPTFVLERLTPYTETNHEGTMIGKLGYEPLHVFSQKLDRNDVPIFGAVKYLIEVVIEGTKSPDTFVKYKDTSERALQESRIEVEKIMEQLFGNESDITDALVQKDAIVVPRNFERTH